MNDTEATITPPSEPSHEGSTASGEQLDAGATEASPTSGATEATPASGEKPKTLSEVVQQAMSKGEETATPAEAGSGESAEKPEGKQDAPPKEEKVDKVDDDKALSQRTRDRIQNLTRERDAFKADHATVQEIRELTGDEQGFNNLRVLLRDFADHPAKSVTMLEQLLSDARSRAGLVIQSEDIKKRVEEGRLDEEAALELEQSRAGQEAARKREQAGQRVRAEQEQQLMVAALDQWEQSVASRTPDYESVRDVVKDTFMSYIALNPVKTPQEAVAAAQASLDKVTGWLSKKIPKTASKVATSSGAPQKAVQKDRSVHDVVRRLLS